ncbi:MAG: hypothetical protein A3A61_00055 [Candidatus Woykebacteria bacterium RIFCSPLOWO2_01_FULL_43_14]|uniref:Uncharacterized protein n=1 Tax=Candidatus Woykebacteria bacterium RIFCSPLOWO2_01_FULL_43_14 TaxID=1802605 RepID=A0A1G1WYF4_9BACT|nr:MAG: hypothetical protein A3A61_00055 [Candidatus Woykebacteria bacterium RIFCSPLOWO2_01_FULL_43_14]
MKLVTIEDTNQLPDYTWDDLRISGRMLRNILRGYVGRIEISAVRGPVDKTETMIAVYKITLLLPKGRKQLLISIAPRGIYRCRQLDMQWKQYLPEALHDRDRDLFGNTVVRNDLLLEILRCFAGRLAKLDRKNTFEVRV